MTAPSPSTATEQELAEWVDADQIPDAIEALARVADGTPWKEAGIPGVPARVSQDIRGYYETAALGLTDHAPAAWSGTRWFSRRDTSRSHADGCTRCNARLERGQTTHLVLHGPRRPVAEIAVRHLIILVAMPSRSWRCVNKRTKRCQAPLDC